MNIHGTISTIIIMNIPITPKIFLMLLHNLFYILPSPQATTK